MSGLQYRDPVRAISGGVFYPGAELSVLLTADDSVAPIYADPGFTTRLSNPLTANAVGRWPAVYVNPEQTCRAIASSTDGAPIFNETVETFTELLALFDDAPRADGGTTLPFATYTFYAAGTTELETIYADEALTVELDNPLTADSAGAFETIWLNAFKAYRPILKDREGRLIFDIERFSFRADLIPPTPPVLSGQITGVDDDVASLSWTAATAPEPIEGYRIYNAATDVLLFDTADPAILTHDFTGLADDTEFSYYVIAYTASLDSLQSNTVVLNTGHPDTVTDIYNTPGSFTWTKRVGFVSGSLYMRPGGGGGASGRRVFGTHVGGAGGGGGELRLATILAADVGATETVTVGAGGPGGARTSSGTANSGTDGGNSSFGSLVIAIGGAGAIGGNPSAVSVPGNATGNAGGTGGTGGTGTAGKAGGIAGAQGGDSTGGASPGGGGGANNGSYDDGVRGGNGPNGEAGGIGGSTITNFPANGGDGDPPVSNDSAGGGGGGGENGGTSLPGYLERSGGNGGKGKQGAGGGGGGGGFGSGSGGTVTAGAGGDGGDGIVVVVSNLS